MGDGDGLALGANPECFDPRLAVGPGHGDHGARHPTRSDLFAEDREGRGQSSLVEPGLTDDGRPVGQVHNYMMPVRHRGRRTEARDRLQA